MSKTNLRNPLVSIVTPSYNSGRFIEESIKSILSQDYPNIEHIIQDGASDDNTVDILKKYAHPKYRDKIKWISQRDNGPVDAYNQALLRARGEIVLFLGADDILMPGSVSWGVRIMAKFPKVAVIYGDEYIIDEKSRILKTFIPKAYNFTKLLCLELVPPAEASFIRRSAFEKVGFYLDKSLKNAPDYELWVRIGLKYPIKHVRHFITKYRWHPKSRSRNPNFIYSFVHEKKQVMDKLFLSPTTPNDIKRLKNRAYTGLYFWAASMQINSGANYDALNYLIRALQVDPSEKKLDEYIKYWKQTSLNNEYKNQGKIVLNNSQPLVSVVTPSYNSGRYLEECIRSVLDQDYPYVEHIIQDGDSTDNTKRILKKYQILQYQHRLKIFSEPDMGQSDGLNRAIQKSKGDIILVLNADDILLPHAVSWAVENMAKYPNVGVIYGDAYIINENGEIINIYSAKNYSFEELLCVELVPPSQAAFIRRKALEKVGFWADSTLDTCPDYEMWVRIAQKFAMKHVWGVVTKYRHYRSPQLDSKMPRMTKRFVAAKKEVMDRLFNSQKTPKEIKKLRRRAYASLDLWASQVAFDMKQTQEGVYYVLRSFLRRPTLPAFLRILQIAKMFTYFAALRTIKFLKSAF